MGGKVYNVLHPQIAEMGLDVSIKESLLIDTKDTDMVRFNYGYLRTCINIKIIQRRFCYMIKVCWLFWNVNFMTQAYFTITEGVSIFRISGNSDEFVGTTVFLFALDLGILLPFSHNMSIAFS